ncbi:hypothetical protein C5S29_06580 [ANME-1 cluster archaeon GoMg3.2]|nr:hypothetical protein [ANME-1 cluster archaeon GoMg3.2]
MVEAQYTTEFPLSDGTYYWRVKAISDNQSKWLWPDKAELTIFTTMKVGVSSDLGIVAQEQHKDTRMLCLGGCPLLGAHAWDVNHVTRGCLHCNWYCVRASISMVNSYYGGSLSQDRISYYILEERPGVGDGLPENDLGHGRGIFPLETTTGLSWALNGIAISNPSGKPTFAQIKAWIDNGQPILRRNVADTWHATVIDGYDDAGQLVHVIDPSTGNEGSLAYDTLSVHEVWVAPSTATARSDEASLTKDSDGDGVYDFDEINRFKTDPNKADSDLDSVPDKAEVRCYTFLSDDSFDSGDTREPDPDGDGLRAELDKDSDHKLNDGVHDGCEDFNRNGRVDSGETDPLDETDDNPLNIVSPTKSSTASAGAYDYPTHIDVKLDVIGRTTPITGLTNADFTFKIGGKAATASLTDTSTPGRYVFDVTPPEQDDAGKYDLEVLLKYGGCTFEDKEENAVIYTTAGHADVMLIIDRSGSMDWPSSKIEDAKASAKLFVDYMRDDDYAGVVSFASSASYNYHLTPLTAAIKIAIKTAIDAIYASGSTAMGAGLRYGLNDLTSLGDPTHSWAMVLLSDGYHNSGEHPDSVLPDIKVWDIRVFTIGLGDDVDRALLEHIATETGGEYYYAATSDQLREIYELIVGRVVVMFDMEVGHFCV